MANLPATEEPSGRFRAIRNAVIVWFVLNLLFQLVAVTAVSDDGGGEFFTRLADHARGATATYTFAILSTTAVAATVVALYWARSVGHALTATVGVMMLAGGVATLTTDLPFVLTVALLIFGVAAVALAWRSWQGGRAAWAFAVALDGVLALVTLFGAPKVRGLLHVDIWAALVPTTLAIAACASLASLAASYESEADGASVAAR